MSKYLVRVPFVDDMGSTLPFIVSPGSYETKEEAALSDINSSRDHDGLKPLTRLPNGTKFERLIKGEI